MKMPNWINKIALQWYKLTEPKNEKGRQFFLLLRKKASMKSRHYYACGCEIVGEDGLKYCPLHGEGER